MNQFYNKQTSAYYLAKHCRRKKNGNRKMRVVFLVQEPAEWDKQRLVYEAFMRREDTETFLVLLSSFSSNDLTAGRPYGAYDKKKWHFFHDQYKQIYDLTNIGDLRILSPDYVFYPFPYNRLLLDTVTSNEVAKFAKVCFIPYGAIGAEIFLQLELAMEDFFQASSFNFLAWEEEKQAFENMYPDTVRLGLQHFECLGYPAFEEYLHPHSRKGNQLHVLWTPRWSYDATIGGSHFFECKDAYIQMADSFGKAGVASFGIRPHPLMFQNFLDQGRMTEEEYKQFLLQLEEAHIVLDNADLPASDALQETDILVTDFSTIISMYFLLDRPMIYCPAHKLLPAYEEMLQVAYIAESPEDIPRYLEQLLQGIDPLKEKRSRVVRKYREMHCGASQRIVQRIVQDFEETSTGTNLVDPPLEAETWIWEQKKLMSQLLLHLPPSCIAEIVDQPWYQEYIGLLRMPLTTETLRQEEQTALRRLQRWYIAYSDKEQRHLAILAMMLFADPMEFPFPLETHVWPKQLWQDVRDTFIVLRNIEERKE